MWYNISHEVIVVLDLLEWLQNNQLGEMVFTTLVSMVPVVELRGGLPFGVALGLPYWAAYLSAVVGNILPAPFIVVYIRRIFQWMRRRLPRLDHLVDRLEAAGIPFTELSGVQANPRSGKVYEGIDLVRRTGADFLLALGGGSVIDTAPARHWSLDRRAGRRLFGHAAAEGPALHLRGRAHRRVPHPGPHLRLHVPFLTKTRPRA
mgnify:CR=1 FL=1